jgi:hypothetical protein
VNKWFLGIIYFMLFVFTGLFAQQLTDFKWEADKLGGIVITGYSGTSRMITISGKINGMPVVAIKDHALRRKQLTSVTIPDSVISIGDNAFWSNQLTFVSISECVTSIGEAAFASNQLTSVTIGANVSFNGYMLGDVFNAEGSFNEAYDKADKQAGIYTRPNVESTTWTRR